MGTTTALLHWGDGHPYDDGLWGDFSTIRLIEGGRCAWVQESPHTVWLANPRRIFADGLRAAGGAPHWAGFPEEDTWTSAQYQAAFAGKRVVLCILQGSSLKPDACQSWLERWDIASEVLANSSPEHAVRRAGSLRDLRLT